MPERLKCQRLRRNPRPRAIRASATLPGRARGRAAALEARRQGQPIDRLLRIQEIAFQEPRRRQRLETVAVRWYQLEGDEPIPEALRIAVISDCERLARRHEALLRPGALPRSGAVQAVEVRGSERPAFDQLARPLPTADRRDRHNVTRDWDRAGWR